MTAHDTLQTTMAHVTAPAGTTGVGEWHADGAECARTLHGGNWTVANVSVSVVGEQRGDGTAAWMVDVDYTRGLTGDLSGEQARELAAALVEAATVLERLTAAGDKVGR